MMEAQEARRGRRTQGAEEAAAEEGQGSRLVRVAASQVMALDVDGDMRTDLLGVLLDLDPISGDCRAAGVAVWKNQGNGSFELIRNPFEAEVGAAGARAVRSLKALRLRPGAAAVELGEQNLSDAHGAEVADYIR